MFDIKRYNICSRYDRKLEKIVTYFFTTTQISIVERALRSEEVESLSCECSLFDVLSYMHIFLICMRNVLLSPFADEIFKFSNYYTNNTTDEELVDYLQSHFEAQSSSLDFTITYNQL